MLTFSLEDLLVIVVVWLLCGLVSAILFVRFAVMRYAGRAVIRSITSPDEETRKAVSALLLMILQAPIATGKKIKTEDGEKDEVLPFFKYALREMGNAILLKFNAMMGGTSKEMGEQLDAELSMNPKFALFKKFKRKRKDQSMLDYVMEAVVENPQLLDNFKNVQKDASATNKW